jgi:diaminopimelate epimerase
MNSAVNSPLTADGAGLSFRKYHGLGNDFVVLDVQSRPSSSAGNPPEFPLARVQHLCDRHFGIGADGLLLVSPPANGAARARMTVLNADGSRPEMCGNGLRCVALHLALGDGSERARYVIETDAGLRTCDVERHGTRALITAALGQAEVLNGSVHELLGERLAIVPVSVGNPHAVVFDANHTIADIDRLGAALSANIAGGVNVEFVRPAGGRRFEVVVWERGVGRTLACGTGAGAVAAAACLAGRAGFGEWIDVALPGGVLAVRVSQGSLLVEQRGPAELVYSGELARAGTLSQATGSPTMSAPNVGAR